MLLTIPCIVNVMDLIDYPRPLVANYLLYGVGVSQIDVIYATERVAPTAWPA